MYIILKARILKPFKRFASFIIIIIFGFLLILAGLFIKYKPIYEVTILGQELGYVENKDEFKELIECEILSQKGKNIDDISLIQEPEYELKFLARTVNTNENEVIEKIKTNNTITTYKYYYVSLNNEIKSYVDTLQEAEELVNEIKEEFGEDAEELNLQIFEKYTQNADEIKADSLYIAENTIEETVNEIKEEKERNEALAIINDIKLSVLPVTGRITSRYGESSSIRRSKHTGLDIACSTGTDIKVVSKGIVTCAKKSGAYGNLVKVDHGNGVETWYGHCSKIYVKEGDAVDGGDVIAAVGSTGNSTGPHLHFEIRIDGNTVNPQNYVY